MVGQQDLLVVVNAAAGSARRRQIDAAMGALRGAAARERAHVELVATTSLQHLADTLTRLAGRRLVVLGGDGSVQSAVHSLRAAGELRAAGPIGIIPLGTGNDLARSLRLPTDPADAARTVLTGTAQEMALLVADDGIVAANAVHIGIGAVAAKTAADVKPRLSPVGLSRLAYPAGAVVAGLTQPGWRLRVSVDSTVLYPGEQHLLMVAIGLGGTVGGGAPLVPGADPRDALADVVISEAVGPLARIGYARQLPTGSHVRRADVRTTRARVVKIEAAPGHAFLTDGDGELRGPFMSRRWEVEPNAWRAIGPAEHPT